MISPRGYALGALVTLVTALVVFAVFKVPWTSPPAPEADQVAALRSLPVDAVARGRAFQAELRPSGYAGLLLGLAVALALGLTPLGARLVELVARPFHGHWLARALLGGVAIALVGEVIAVPLAAWRHAIVRRYGLSTQAWGGWTVDLLKGYAIGAVIGAVTLGAFFALTRFAPRWWWAIAAPGAAGLVALLSFVFPVLVEPVFNTFTPMEQGKLRSDLLAMAERDGVPVRDVLVADASRRTRAVNAYVSGFGPTRRIVVYDTLLREAPPEEVESVVAHELGHAKENDVWTGTLLGMLGAAAAVVALYLLGSWRAPLRLAGVTSLTEPRAVALLLAAATVVGMIAGPLQGLVSRKIEARADGHALALTGDPKTFEAMQAHLVAANLGDPAPPRLEYLLFASHPSTVERMAVARSYARIHGDRGATGK